MIRDKLVEFLTELGMWPLKPSGNDHFKIKCLYRRSRHDSGQDTHPSATISFDYGESWFRCHACGTARPFHVALEQTAGEFGNYHWSNIARHMRERETFEAQQDGVKPLTERKIPPIQNYAAGLQKIIAAGGKDYPPEALEHLESKGLTVSTARKSGILYVPPGYTDEFISKDEHGNPIPVADDTIVIPTFYNDPTSGQLWCVGAQGRPLHATTRKYYTFYSYSSHHHLYGQHLLHRVAGKPLFVEEGQYDVAHTWQEGFCAVGLFGLFITRRRIHLIKQAQPSKVIVFLDPDKEGQKAVDRVVEEFSYEEIEAEPVLGKYDPKHCSASDFRDLAEGG